MGRKTHALNLLAQSLGCGCYKVGIGSSIQERLGVRTIAPYAMLRAHGGRPDYAEVTLGNAMACMGESVSISPLPKDR